MSDQVAPDMVVGIDYVLTVDGAVLDSTEGAAPLEYLQGRRTILPALEDALAGLRVGETATVELTAEQGYGKHDANAFVNVPRDQLPKDYPLEEGMGLRIRDEDGQVRMAYVAVFNDEEITLDLNHPLAGKDLSFAVRVASLRPATEEELRHGRVGGCAGCGSASDCGPEGCG